MKRSALQSPVISTTELEINRLLLSPEYFWQEPSSDTKSLNSVVSELIPLPIYLTPPWVYNKVVL
jgi:hypothetical protein